MGKEIFGVYEYQGISKINPLLNDDENIDNTAFHELIHKQLTEDTAYGDFVTHIKLLSKTLKEYSHSANVLEFRMLNMQESVAYFLESLYIKSKKDSHEFNIYLNRMKKENRQNFNLMNKLDYLFKLPYNSKEDYVDIINLVKIMGIASLSFSFLPIKIGQLKSPHKLKTYLNNNDIDPNQKFVTINKFVKDKVEKGTPIISIIDGILKKFSPKYNGWEQDYRDVLIQDTRYEKIKMVYPTVFENLNNVSIVNINTGEKKDLVEDMPQFDFIHAGAMSDYPDKIVELNNFLKVIKEDKGSLYVYGAYSKEIDSQVEYAVSFKSVSQTTNFVVKGIDEDKLHKIIEELHVLNGVAATPLAFDYHQGKLLKLNKELKRNLYIYFDVPYAYSRIFLKEMLKTEMHPAFYIEYPNFNILVIQINKNHIFLIPIVKLSTISLQQDLDNGHFKLHFADTDDAFKNGRINKEAIEVIDAIVNASLNIGLANNSKVIESNSSHGTKEKVNGLT